jgi:hypothetical protein
MYSNPLLLTLFVFFSQVLELHCYNYSLKRSSKGRRLFVSVLTFLELHFVQQNYSLKNK